VDFGTITLTFNPDKTIRGTYRPDIGDPTTVTDGLTGGRNLRLQIGGRRFSGRFTRRGFAVTSATASGSGSNLWGQFARV